MMSQDSDNTILAVSEAFNGSVAGHRQPETKPFSMRLTAKERSFLDAHCGGRSWAAFIRERVFGEQASVRKAVRRPRIEDQTLATALAGLGQSRIASNLNQLAKSANIGTLPVSDYAEQQLLEACAAVLEMRKALILALGLKDTR